MRHPTNRYEVRIFFSVEDAGWIAVAPELPGCSAFGLNQEQALKDLQDAIKSWIDCGRGGW